MQTSVRTLRTSIKVLCLVFGLLLGGGVAFGQLPEAPPSPAPDARYKADILVVVAHPDDESGISAYLARAIYDEHKTVAVVFGTCGSAGENTVGYEQAASLCAVRKIEARRALASLGIMNVWFLGGVDTAGQNPLISLETWGHGSVLANAIRYVRLTRPEVIITWLPDYADGENHGDHQAASIIATEAFDMAGDPTVFPEQVAPPYDHLSIGNLTEGLRPWQPQKLYFFTNAAHRDWIKGLGPEYSVTDVSPSQHVPYYELRARELSYHLSQTPQGAEGRDVVYKNIVNRFKTPVELILGKSLVPSSTTGDVFQGTTPNPISYHPAPKYQAQPHQGIALELGGPWLFYRQFWTAHGLDQLAKLYPPEAGVGPGTTISVPLILRNDTDAGQNVAVTATIPAGWVQTVGNAVYPVGPHNFYPIRADFKAPEGQRPTWQEIDFNATVNGRIVSSVVLRVSNVPSGPRATLRR